MKTINSKKHSKICDDIQLFADLNTNKQTGFAGNVELYDSTIYVDTRDGTGYDKVISKLGSLIYKFAVKYHFNGNSFEDTQHDIIIHILEGITRYNPNKNTKLSTFLETHVNNRLINTLRDSCRVTRNATFLNIGTYKITCSCGEDVIAVFDGKSGYEKNCKKCNRPLNKAIKKLPLNTPEVNESMLTPNKFCDDLYDTNIGLGSLLNEVQFSDNGTIFFHDIKKWLQDEDPRVVKIIELYCFKDYSIKAAAEEAGISGAGGNMKLKELAKNPHIREILGR